MSNINKRALREVAEKATKGPWTLFSDIDTKTFSIHTPQDKRCENVIKWGGFDCQPNAESNAEFIAAFNPKVALALLDENIQLLREKDAIEAVALALRDDMRRAREQLASAECRNAELDKRLIEYAGIATREAHRVAELEARTVSIPEVRITVAESKRKNLTWRELGAYNEGADVAKEAILAAIRAADIKVKEE